MLLIRRVSGPSMKPTLRHGQVVVFVKSKRISEGDIVLCKINGSDSVKRVTKIRDDEVWIEGDNKSASTDSREFGWVSDKFIVGKVLLTFPK